VARRVMGGNSRRGERKESITCHAVALILRRGAQDKFVRFPVSFIRHIRGQILSTAHGDVRFAPAKAHV
jgi:hypothetical protein